jgi:hypothetical protein
MSLFRITACSHEKSRSSDIDAWDGVYHRQLQNAFA